MVVQSWEDESRRLRGKDISPCRLLFLDEAARLDARSIATLFELCERLQMQLIIAAPKMSARKAPPINWCVKSSRIPNMFMSSACEDLRRNSLKRFQEVTKRLLRRVLNLRRQQCRLFFSENSVSALKKWHITARFSLNFFTLGYVKTYQAFIY
ncbi:hypothetical protein ACLB1Q_10080 [Escherichia coli]